MKRAARHLLSAMLLTSAVISTPTSAKADIINQTFSFSSPITHNGSFFSSNINQFDPILGILNSVSVSITGSASAGRLGFLSVNLGVDTYPQMIHTNFPNSNFTLINLFSKNLRPVYFGGDNKDPNDIAIFTGNNKLKLGISITSFNFSCDPISVILDPNSTITYDFTPSSTMPSAVPEPATWAMMLIGFAGLAFAAGQRRDHRNLVAR